SRNSGKNGVLKEIVCRFFSKSHNLGCSAVWRELYMRAYGLSLCKRILERRTTLERFQRRSGRGLLLLAALLACGVWGCATSHSDYQGSGRQDNPVTLVHAETPVTPQEKPALPPAVDAARRAFTPVEATLVDADNDFGLRLLGQLTKG